MALYHYRRTWASKSVSRFSARRPGGNRSPDHRPPGYAASPAPGFARESVLILKGSVSNESNSENMASPYSPHRFYQVRPLP